jgi:uncharacterized RDD family membrane protein YckC
MPKKPKEIVVEANIFRRFLAFAIDLIIIQIIISISFGSLLDKVFRKDFSTIEQITASLTDPLMIKIGMIVSLISLIYFAAMEYKLSQSLGKMLLNLHVQNDEKDKKIWQYVVRSFYFIPFFPFDLFWIIDPIYMIFDKDRRRFSETLSKTRTVGKMVIEHEAIRQKY